ncbi:MAG: BON domain-containing protein [Planctomycetaceae bacterium]|nr:BON domain-containing protein [Planctomycetaceae bacterium]
MRLPRKWVLSLGLMAAAPGAAFAGPLDFLKPDQPATTAGAPQSNQQLAEAVKSALERAHLKGKDIAIEVKGGVVKLEGQIADSQQKAAAGRIIMSVPGIQTVDNRLVVMETAGAPRAMPQEPAVQQAGFDGSSRGGVRPVSNEVLPTSAGIPQSNEQVARDIAGALAGSGLQGYDIEVRYKGGVAALVGEVGSAQEAQVAQQAAQSVPGVNQVLNNLTVNGQPAAAQGQMGPGGPQGGYPAMPVGFPGQQPGGYPAPQGYPMQPAGYQGPGGPPMGPGVPPGPTPTAGHLVHNAPSVPEYAWPSYAPYDNYSQVSYPSSYDASAWPYIGPFYPYPQVPMEWRSAQLEWDDGHWQLKFHSRTDKWWWFLDPHNWQ